MTTVWTPIVSDYSLINILIKISVSFYIWTGWNATKGALTYCLVSDKYFWSTIGWFFIALITTYKNEIIFFLQPIFSKTGSGPPIKRTSSIKWTLSRVPKVTSYISLYTCNKPLYSGHLYQVAADTKINCTLYLANFYR